MKILDSLEMYLKETADCKINDLLDEQEHIYQIKNMDKAASMIYNAAKAGRHIHVVGDYDADGICALTIMHFIIRTLTTNYALRVPKRISEGYGLNEHIVDEIPAGSLLITVDNGIAAVDAIKKTKAKGCEVLVLDHHIPTDTLPEADLVIDPEVLECEIKTKYCGAGLCFKLAEAMWQDEAFLNFLASFAAIATIADVVPLRYENRRICKKGINALNNGISSAGVLALKRALDLIHVDSSNVAFKIAPCLNSPGRLYDDGGRLSVMLLCNTDADSAENMTADIISINKKRKALVADAMTEVENLGLDENAGANIVTVSAPEGILGIIAGQLTEKTKKPSLVLTVTSDGNFKGSARSLKGNHLKKILDEVNAADATVLSKYGGHELAAGFSVCQGKLETFKKLFLSKVNENVPEPENVCILCKAADVPNYAATLEYLEPFGQSLKRPLFYINAVAQPMDASGTCCKFLGANNEHVKLSLGNKVSAIGFYLAEQYREIGFSSDIRIVGDVSFNYFGNSKYPQVTINEFC